MNKLKRYLATTILSIALIPFVIIVLLVVAATHPFAWAFGILHKGDDRDEYYGRL